MPAPKTKGYVETGSCVVCGKTIYASKGAWLRMPETQEQEQELDLLSVDD
jgi:hypothetical protein